MNKELIDRTWACLPKEFKEEVKKEYFNSRKYDGRIACACEKLFGRHNLTSDAEGEEMLTVSRKKVQEMYALNEDILFLDSTHRGARLLKAKLQELFGSKCLPDEEYTTCVHASGTACERYNHEEHHCSLHGECKFKPKSISEISEEISDVVAKTIKAEFDEIDPKPAEPMFKVGDKVRILSLHGSPTPDEGVVDVIAHINIGNREQMYYLENHYHCAFGFSESDLEPYTEPTANKIGNPDISNASKSVPLESDSTDHVGKSNETVDRDHNRLHIAAMAMQGILSNEARMARYEEIVKTTENERLTNLVARNALRYADALIAESEIIKQPLKNKQI